MKAIMTIAGAAQDVQRGPDLDEMIHMTALLKEERRIVIDNLMTDIAAYLEYKFETKPTVTQQERIKRAIVAYSECPISNDTCKTAAASLRRGMTKASRSNLFYQEIDKIIRTTLRPAQLELGITVTQRKMV